MKRLIHATAAIGVLAVLSLAMPASAAVPNPIVTGPIPNNVIPGDPSHDYTFFATQLDLAGQGYVEEEYFIEGTANRYTTPALATGSIIDGGHPYRTRIVARPPISPAQFNGTVILEWQNVTAGYDIDASWVAGGSAFLMRDGYVWVGVSAQRVGVHQPGTGLRDWSPIRYGTLDVTQGGTILNDALSYDIFSQAAQAIMHPVGVNPLGGLVPQRIVASGASQSASRLTIYYNSIQPLAGIFNGFELGVGGGFVRTDLGVPVFKIYSETDIQLLGAAFAQQPDTNIHRTWQVAGAAHADRYFLDSVVLLANRDGIPTTPPGLCTNPEGSTVHLYYVVNAAVDAMNRWIKDGTPPPTAPPLTIASLGPPTILARNSLGLALGGIRLADVDVPTALNTGINGGPSFCLLFGTHVPFDADALAALYANHGDYVSAVNHVTDANEAAGYLLFPDAEETSRTAAQSRIGKK